MINRCKLINGKKEILSMLAMLCWCMGVSTRTIIIQYKIIFIVMAVVLTGLILKRANNVLLNSIYVSMLSFVSIEVCNLNNLQLMAPDKFLYNFVLLISGYMILHLLIDSVHICNTVYMLIWTIIAMVAYYVYEFRQIPLSISNVYQIRTVLLVLPQYQIKLASQVIFAGYSFGLCVIFSIINKRVSTHNNLGKKVFWFVLGAVVIIILFGTPVNKILKIKTLSWNLQEVYHRNGLVLNCMQDLKGRGVDKPEGFTEEKYNIICRELNEPDTLLNSTHNYPNIILIVNESWFDMHQICNYSANEEMPFIHSLQNLVKGYMLNPNTTTGNSEYEILTSNSLYIRKNTVPFLEGNLLQENSMVKNLKQIGYTTYALHSEPGFSYNRVNAYQTLGFDYRIFLKDERDRFSEDEIVRESVSDATLFREIIKQYELAQSSCPKFIYCLTMQNHGGYNLGGISKLDVREDFGVYTDELEEYLGLLQYTDEAFKELVSYFEKIDDDTIICMVGDHAPIVADSIYDKGEKLYEKKVTMHSTPVIIWANYPLNDPKDLGHSSMIYLAETLFEFSGLPLTAYYKYIKDMKEEIPIVGLGYYKGVNGKYYDFEDESPYEEILRKYLYLEYGNIKNVGSSVNIYEY